MRGLSLRFLKLAIVCIGCSISNIVISQHLSIVNTVGNGELTFVDGSAPLETGFQAPGVIAIDSDENIYFGVAAIGSSGIFKVNIEENSIERIVDDVDYISSIAVDENGCVYYSFGGVAAESQEYIYCYNQTTGITDTIAGNGIVGYPVNGEPARETHVGNVGGIKIGPAGKYLYYSATLFAYNYIQRIDLTDTDRRTYRVAGVGATAPDTQDPDGVDALSANLNLGLGLAWDNYGHLYFATEAYDDVAPKPGIFMIKQLNANDGKIYHLAGDGEWEYSETDNLAATASIGSSNSGILINTSGELIICDYLNDRIRKISLPVDKPTGEETIETIAGSGYEEDDADNPTGDLNNLEFKEATLTNMNPKDMVQTSDGYYFSDEDAKRIRRIFVCKNPEITSTSIDREVICQGDQVTMSFEGDISDGTVWDWYEGSCNVGGEDLGNDQSLTVTVDENISYYAVGRGGCSHDVECQVFELEVSCRDFFNAFTPNKDGINEFLEIPILETYPTNQVIIYNRWGELLEQIDNYDNVTTVWYGTNGGEDTVDSGTYYFTAEANGELITSGWVEVVK